MPVNSMSESVSMLEEAKQSSGRTDQYTYKPQEILEIFSKKREYWEALLKSGKFEELENEWNKFAEFIPWDTRYDTMFQIVQQFVNLFKQGDFSKPNNLKFRDTVLHFLGILNRDISRTLGYTPRGKGGLAVAGVNISEEAEKLSDEGVSPVESLAITPLEAMQEETIKPSPLDVFSKLVNEQHDVRKSKYNRLDVILGLEGCKMTSARICDSMREVVREFASMTNPYKLKSSVDEGGIVFTQDILTQDILDGVNLLCAFDQRLVLCKFQKFNVNEDPLQTVDLTQYTGSPSSRLCLELIWTSMHSWKSRRLSITDMELTLKACVAGLGLAGYKVIDRKTFVSAIWLYCAQALPAEIVGYSISKSVTAVDRII